MSENTADSGKPSDTSGFTCHVGAGRETRPHLVSAHLLQSMTTSWLASGSPWRRTYFPGFWKCLWEDHPGAGAEGQWAQDDGRVVRGGWMGRKHLTTLRPWDLGSSPECQKDTYSSSRASVPPEAKCWRFLNGLDSLLAHPTRPPGQRREPRSCVLRTLGGRHPLGEEGGRSEKRRWWVGGEVGAPWQAHQLRFYGPNCPTSSAD